MTKRFVRTSCRFIVNQFSNLYYRRKLKLCSRSIILINHVLKCLFEIFTSTHLRIRLSILQLDLNRFFVYYHRSIISRIVFNRHIDLNCLFNSCSFLSDSRQLLSIVKMRSNLLYHFLNLHHLHLFRRRLSLDYINRLQKIFRIDSSREIRE